MVSRIGFAATGLTLGTIAMPIIIAANAGGCSQPDLARNGGSHGPSTAFGANSANAAAESAGIGTSNMVGATVISSVQVSAIMVTTIPSPSEIHGSQPHRNW